jgi:hypothetical protein
MPVGELGPRRLDRIERFEAVQGGGVDGLTVS